jgi:hypothetical protein
MRTPSKLHYAWIIAAVTFVVLLLTAGIRAAPGVLIVPLEQEFHWLWGVLFGTSCGVIGNFLAAFAKLAARLHASSGSRRHPQQ